MFGLRTHLVIMLCLFAALFGLAIVGNALESAGIRPLGGRTSAVAMAVFFGLFLVAGLSAIPVIVKAVLGAQARLGNAAVPVVATAIRSQNLIIWMLWGLIIAGLVVALPAMIADGFFGAGPQTAISHELEGASQGRLAARPGMTLADMTRQSTLKLDLRYADTAIAGGGAFDYAIPGTGIVFPHARYYFITTYENDHQRVRWLTVGTSPEKVSHAGLAAEDAALRARLIADGWLAGREVYRDEEDRALHGGASEGPEGRHWLKGGMVLDIEDKRMDDEKPGENPATAGEWIQFIELWPQRELPGIDRLVFRRAPSQR